MNREVLNLKYYKGSDLYSDGAVEDQILEALEAGKTAEQLLKDNSDWAVLYLALIHISEPTIQAEISYAVFCLKKKLTGTVTCETMSPTNHYKSPKPTPKSQYNTYINI